MDTGVGLKHHRSAVDQLVDPDLHQLAGPPLRLCRQTQPTRALGIDELGKLIKVVTQLMKQLRRDEIDQGVFQRLSRKTHPVAPAQAGLTENVAFTKSVEQLTITPVDFHRAAADVVQIGDLLTQLQNRRARLKVAHLHLPGGFIQRLFRQLIKGREATEVVAYLDQFDIHGQHLAMVLLDSVLLILALPTTQRKTTPDLSYSPWLCSSTKPTQAAPSRSASLSSARACALGAPQIAKATNRAGASRCAQPINTARRPRRIRVGRKTFSPR